MGRKTNPLDVNSAADGLDGWHNKRFGGWVLGPLDLINLKPLMQRTSGRADLTIGLIDGPVVLSHPELAADRIREIGGRAACEQAGSLACQHGTMVAGILCAQRGSAAPAICPGCTLLVRPIFAEATAPNGQMPSATMEELAAAIVESIEAGARVLNLSIASARPSLGTQRRLEEALDLANQRGVLVVAAAGNQGVVGSAVITSHPWVIPVVACDQSGRPMNQSNLGHTMGRRGVRAPGHQITSLGSDGRPRTFAGTSAATPFVTGAMALLWSEFPKATAAQVKFAVTEAASPRRTTIVPPLLNAWAAYQAMRQWT
jgi:subtilisin family serine protease